MNNGLDLNALEDIDREFLLNEYTQINIYLVNIEKSMLDLLKLFTTVLALIVPVSAFISKFVEKNMAGLFLGLLLLIFFFLGVYILAMYIELRIRKIKTLEQIVVFRQQFILRHCSVFSKFLKMINSIQETPPYLRIPSSEWYTVIYISFINGLAFSLSCCFILLWLIKYLINTLEVSNFILGLVFFILFLTLLIISSFSLFGWATKYCHGYDIEREKIYSVSNQYNLLETEVKFSKFFKLLEKLAKYYEHKIE